jgi:hypothetical protein
LASLSSAASGASVPLIAALTSVEWTFRSFAYSGRFQKSFSRGTDSVNTWLYGRVSRNSGELRTSVRAGTPPSWAHFFCASGVWNHLMKFSASACLDSGMYFEMCRPMPPSGTRSVTCLGSGAKASLSRISSLVLPSLELFGSSRPPIAAIHWKPTQTLPWLMAALTSSMNQLLEPFGVSGTIWLTSTSIAFLPAASLMTPSILRSSGLHSSPP